MVYTISFGHSIVPKHHHINEIGEHTEEAHCGSDAVDHEHISHNDHFDEGFWDFLGCLIENLHQELPADHHSCETISIVSQKVKTDRVIVQQVPSVSSETSGFILEKRELSNYNSPYLLTFSIEQSSFSRRGPPQF